MKPYILSLDQGTTSSRAVIFDKNQNIIGITAKEYPQIYPKPGWVEHNPMDILNSQLEVMDKVLKENNVSPAEIAAIGITNQRETTIIWDRQTGMPIYNAIVWQCRRTSDMTEKLYQEGHAERITEITGLKPDAYFSATKIRWILDHIEGAQERAEKGELCAGTVDTWLIWNLTKGKSFMTDYSNASRTMLFNIKDLKWDSWLLDLFNIPEVLLPKVVDSSHNFGSCRIGDSDITIGGVAGDQQSSLFGQACFNPGDTKNTYGTGCFLLKNTGDQLVRSQHGLLTTIAYGLNGKVTYALEGSVFNAGSVIQWLRDELRIIEKSSDMGRICSSIPDTGGVYLVPAFTGLGTPYWDMRARGVVVGITRSTNREHLIRAAEESIAYQVCDVVNSMDQDMGYELTSLKVDGGASKDNFLLQFQSGILQCDILRGTCSESTALGAAFLAGLHVGIWSDLSEIEKTWNLERKFSPEMSEEERSKLYNGWGRAIRRSLDWEKE